MSQTSKPSIKHKLLGGVLAMGVVMTVILAGLVIGSHRKYLELDANRTVANSSRIYEAILNSDVKLMSASLDLFTQMPEFKTLFTNGEQAKLFASVEPIFRTNRERYGITHVNFMGPDGETYLRMNKKEEFGDVTTRLTFQKARDRKATASGIELGKDAFALRVVTPYELGGDTIGYVEFGEEIDHFNSLLKKEANVEVSVIVDKNFMNESEYKAAQKANGKRDAWSDLAGHVVMGTTLPSPDHLKQSGALGQLSKTLGGPTVLGNASLEGRTYTCGAFPLKDVKDRVVGSVVVLSDVTDIVQGERMALAVVLGLGLILIGATIWFTYRHLERAILLPIAELTEKANEISMGKVDVKLETDRSDEVGLLIRAFDRMRTSLKKSLDMLQNS